MSLSGESKKPCDGRPLNLTQTEAAVVMALEKRRGEVTTWNSPDGIRETDHDSEAREARAA